MPQYIFKCGACSHQFEIDQSMSEPLPEKCPVCRRHKLEQDFTQHRVVSLVYGSPTTVGQQAEINTKKLGKERLHQTIKSDYTKRKLRLPKGASLVEIPTELPWYRAGEVQGLEKMDRPLDLSKVKDTTTYVETGKMT